MKHPFTENIQPAKPLTQILFRFSGKQPKLDQMFAEAAQRFEEEKEG